MKMTPEYQRVHYFIKKAKPKPKDGKCEECHKNKATVIANIRNHNYTYDINDYMWMCDSCHKSIDWKDYYKSHPEKNKGKNHPMFGRHHTEESKRKMSKRKIGCKRSEETKGKISESMKVWHANRKP